MQVPDWLVGTAAEVRAAVAATAREWARAYFIRGTLAAPVLVEPADRPLLVFSSSDHHPERPAVRLFANVEFQIRADDVLGPGRHPDFLVAYETRTGESAWGSFDNLMSERWPSNLENVCRRLGQALPHLGTLAATEVVNHDNRVHPAATVLERTLDETLTCWDAPAGPPLSVRVETVLQRVRAASPEDVRERVVSSITAAAQVIRRVRHRDWFTPERVREYLASLSVDDYDALTGCTGNTIASEVYAIDRSEIVADE
jgi:hypothetical protein